MEEDIEILEEMKANCIKGMMKGAIYTDKKAERKAIAIENLINGYRKLEEELKREKIWRIRLEKENEDTCNEVNNNYIRKSLVIPKSRIKKKIEELDKKILEYETYREKGKETDVEYYDFIANSARKKILQELMEE